MEKSVIYAVLAVVAVAAIGLMLSSSGITGLSVGENDDDDNDKQCENKGELKFDFFKKKNGDRGLEVSCKFNKQKAKVRYPAPAFPNAIQIKEDCFTGELGIPLSIIELELKRSCIKVKGSDHDVDKTLLLLIEEAKEEILNIPVHDPVILREGDNIEITQNNGQDFTISASGGELCTPNTCVNGELCQVPNGIEGATQGLLGVKTETCGIGECVNTQNVCDGNNFVGCTPGNPTETQEASCADGLDNDCDGSVDCADSDCAGDAACVPVGSCCSFPSGILPAGCMDSATWPFGPWPPDSRDTAKCSGFGLSGGSFLSPGTCVDWSELRDGVFGVGGNCV